MKQFCRNKRMTARLFFGTMGYMKRHMHGIIVGSLVGMALSFIVYGVFVSNAVAAPAAPQAATPLPTAAEQPAISMPGSAYTAPTPAVFQPVAPAVPAAGPTVQAAAAAAQTNTGNSLFTPRYLPNIIQGANGPADMIFFLYKYLMGLVGIVAVGTIIWGGILRTTSQDMGKIKASNLYILNALKGIVLLFGAQVLFNKINPNIVDFPRIQTALQPKEKFTPKVFTWTNIQLASSTIAQQAGDKQVTAESQSGAVALYGTDVTKRTTECTSGKGCDGNGNVDLATKIKPCDGCVQPNFGEGNNFAIKKDGLGACFGGVDNCLVSTPLKGALDKLQGRNQAWQLTEAYPPTVDHESSCHFDGTCVDIGFTGGVTEASVSKLITDATAAGLIVVNESGKGITPKVFATTKGAHLHVRLP